MRKLLEIHPKSIRLEACSACQLKCPSCPTTQGKTKKNLGTGYLQFEDFKKLIDGNPLLHIELSAKGEIFLSPSIAKIIKYAFRKGVILTAFNGVNLNHASDSILEMLVKYRFFGLTCSIDGASQETYAIYRQGGNFNRVIEHIKKINQYKAQYQSLFPYLKWQFIIFGHNEREIPLAKKMAQDLNMKIYFKLNYDENFSPVVDKEFVKTHTGLEVTSRTEYLEKHGHLYMQKAMCNQLWNAPQINWDGRVLGCCVNFWGDFGNAFKEGLLKSLNNEKIVYARQMLLGKRPPRSDIPCVTCSNYQHMKTRRDWLTQYDIKISAKRGGEIGKNDKCIEKS